jgi:outer membrane protein OmpA-like peptidoglycan-associated protein
VLWSSCPSASVKAQLTKIGGLNVNDNPQASTVSIADDQIEPIVELLSEFGTGKSASTSPTTPKRVEAVPSLAPAVANLDQFQQVTDTELRFPSTQTTLDAQAKEALGQVATRLEGRKGSIVEVQGYSYASGQAGIQQSQDMADAVVRYLVVDHHVPVFKIYRLAMGKAPREEPTESGNSGTVVHVKLMANSLEALTPQAPEGGVHMYVQEDAGDTPEDGAKVVQLLRTGWPTANVESAVQRIPSQKMPDVAQVRYFNAADEALADRCIAILRRAYPGARAVRVGLPSPSGQLEVWLPRKH